MPLRGSGDRKGPGGSHLRESQVNPVCEGRDDQPPVQAHVLVAIAEGPRALPDVQLVRVPVPVKPQLTLPFELLGLENAGGRPGESETWGRPGLTGGWTRSRQGERRAARGRERTQGGPHLPLMKESTMSLACTSMMRTVLYFFLSFLLKGAVIRVTSSSICWCIFLP